MILQLANELMLASAGHQKKHIIFDFVTQNHKWTMLIILQVKGGGQSQVRFWTRFCVRIGLGIAHGIARESPTLTSTICWPSSYWLDKINPGPAVTGYQSNTQLARLMYILIQEWLTGAAVKPRWEYLHSDQYVIGYARTDNTAITCR